MATMGDIVGRALRKIGVSAEDEAITSDAMGHGMDALNSMMHAWKLRGVDITHSDLGQSDPFPIGDEYVEGTVFLLARTISPDYSLPANFDADDWFRTFQAAYMTISAATIPLALRRTPSQDLVEVSDT